MIYIRVSSEKWLPKVCDVVLHCWPLRIWVLYKALYTPYSQMAALLGERAVKRETEAL